MIDACFFLLNTTHILLPLAILILQQGTHEVFHLGKDLHSVVLDLSDA
jgi:hypothetical protein